MICIRRRVNSTLENPQSLGRSKLEFERRYSIMKMWAAVPIPDIAHNHCPGSHPKTLIRGISFDLV
jgi:hypothetical protein